MLVVTGAFIWAFGSTHDDFVSVTNDWFQGNYSNVYALAQYREAHNTNDLVAAYIRYEWNAGFGTKVSISNSIERILAASASVTNAAYTNIFWQAKEDLEFSRDVVLPLVSDERLRAEIPLSQKRGKRFGFEEVLKILWDERLW